MRYSAKSTKMNLQVKTSYHLFYGFLLHVFSNGAILTGISVVSVVCERFSTTLFRNTISCMMLGRQVQCFSSGIFLTTQFCVTLEHEWLYRKSPDFVIACFLFTSELKSITANCDLETTTLSKK